MTITKPDPPCPACGGALLDCPRPENLCSLLNLRKATQMENTIRNKAIREAHRKGASEWDLAVLYALSWRTIHRITKGGTSGHG